MWTFASGESVPKPNLPSLSKRANSSSLFSSISCTKVKARRVEPSNLLLIILRLVAPVVVENSKPVSLNEPPPENSRSPFTTSLVFAPLPSASPRWPPTTTRPLSHMTIGLSVWPSIVSKISLVPYRDSPDDVYVWNTCSPAMCLILSGPLSADEASLPLKRSNSVLEKSVLYLLSMICVLPNSSPESPENESCCPITTLPTTSNLPRGTSVPIPTSLVVPPMNRPILPESYTLSGFSVILKSPPEPVTPTAQPLSVAPSVCI